MGFSTARFHQEHQEGEQSLFWGNVEANGAPFLGQPQARTEAERSVVEREVGFTKCGFFDVEKPEEAAKYLAVLDRCLTGWFVLRKQIWFHAGSTRHYLEWIQRYNQDDPRYVRPG